MRLAISCLHLKKSQSQRNVATLHVLAVYAVINNMNKNNYLHQ